MLVPRCHLYRLSNLTAVAMSETLLSSFLRHHCRGLVSQRKATSRYEASLILLNASQICETPSLCAKHHSPSADLVFASVSMPALQQTFDYIMPSPALHLYNIFQILKAPSNRHITQNILPHSISHSYIPAKHLQELSATSLSYTGCIIRSMYHI